MSFYINILHILKLRRRSCSASVDFAMLQVHKKMSKNVQYRYNLDTTTARFQLNWWSYLFIVQLNVERVSRLPCWQRPLFSFSHPSTDDMTQRDLIWFWKAAEDCGTEVWEGNVPKSSVKYKIIKSYYLKINYSQNILISIRFFFFLPLLLMLFHVSPKSSNVCQTVHFRFGTHCEWSGEQNVKMKPWLGQYACVMAGFTNITTVRVGG